MANPNNPGQFAQSQQGGQRGQSHGDANRGKTGDNQGQKNQHNGGRAQELASTAVNRVGEAWDTVRHQAQDWASSVAGTDFLKDVGNFFNRYPEASFAAGVGVGFVLANLFSWPSADMTRRMSYSSERPRAEG